MLKLNTNTNKFFVETDPNIQTLIENQPTSSELPTQEIYNSPPVNDVQSEKKKKDWIGIWRFMLVVHVG